MREQRIVLLGLESIGNTGDEILSATTEWLLTKVTKGEIERKQLMPGYRDIVRYYRTCMFALPIKYISKIFRGNVSYRITNIMYRIKYNRYLKDCIKDADKIILPIGMLKYSTQDFSYIFDMITQIAAHYNKPVLMSAMSIARPDHADWRYYQLVKAVNRPCVKFITTRDGESGLTRLNKYYIKNNIRTDFVGDPALWIPDCYQIKRKTSDNEIIGINVIRKGIYAEYSDKSFSDDQMISMYKEIITELETRGYRWALFCNGMRLDYEVGKQLVKELNLSDDKLLPAPRSGKELVEIISGFKAVFGARLHACITSVSLGVPVSGLIWDDKLDFFSRTMNIRQFFSNVEELKGNLIVDKIESAILHTLDIENVRYYKNKTIQSIKDFVELNAEIVYE